MCTVGGAGGGSGVGVGVVRHWGPRGGWERSSHSMCTMRKTRCPRKAFTRSTMENCLGVRSGTGRPAQKGRILFSSENAIQWGSLRVLHQQPLKPRARDRHSSPLRGVRCSLCDNNQQRLNCIVMMYHRENTRRVYLFRFN